MADFDLGLDAFDDVYAELLFLMYVLCVLDLGRERGTFLFIYYFERILHASRTCGCFFSYASYTEL